MKILHLIYDDLNNPWVGGGGAVRVYEIYRRLSKRHRVVVVTANYPGAKNEKKDGIKYVRIGWGKNYFLSRISYILSVPKWIRRIEHDILIEDISPYSPTFVSLYTKKPCIALIHVLFSNFTTDLKKRLSLARRFFCPLFERLNLRQHRNFICVSQNVKIGLEKLSPKIRKAIVIPNGVNDSLFTSESKEEKYVLFLGRIDIAQKGIDILIKAFSELVKTYKEIKLIIAGDGRNLGKVKDLVKELDLEFCVEFTGRVSKDRKRELLSKCLFLCIPSRYESHPLVVLEAYACGKAVIGTNVPGLRNMILNGETGILVKPDSPKELFKAMSKLIEDAHLRKRLGENGRRLARKYNWNEIAKEQERFYYQCLK